MPTLKMASAKHECPELKKRSLPTSAPIISIGRYGYDQKWELEHFDYIGIIIEIQYCPFCGLELSATPNKCRGLDCEHYDPVATVEWRECCHPKRYTIEPIEVAAPENVIFDPSHFKIDSELPENYTDHGCPLGDQQQ